MIVRRRGMLLVLLVVAGVAAPAAWSDQFSATAAPPHDQVDEVMGRYNLHPAFAKLGRGISNTLGGWLELPLNIQQRYTPRDTGGSLFTGIAYGVFKGLVRTAVGLYETVTFFLPYPEDFAPILPTLPYFEQPATRRPGPSS